MNMSEKEKVCGLVKTYFSSETSADTRQEIISKLRWLGCWATPTSLEFMFYFGNMYVTRYISGLGWLSESIWSWWIDSNYTFHEIVDKYFELEDLS